MSVCIGDLGLAGMTMAEIERRALIETLRACGGNKTRTARLLGVSEKTIYNKIKQHKLGGIRRRKPQPLRHDLDHLHAAREVNQACKDHAAHDASLPS